MKYIDLPDGTLMKCHSPVQGTPFYSEWLEALLLRRAALARREVHQKCRGTGCPDCKDGYKLAITPLTADQEQAAEPDEQGNVMIICLGCATPTPYQQIISTTTAATKSNPRRQVAADRIVIGGRVQYKDDQPCNERNGSKIVSLVRRWKVLPVSKKGWGCSACLTRYVEEERRIAVENEQKFLLHQVMTEVYTKRQDWTKLKALREPKLFTAYLDVFNHSVTLYQFRPSEEQQV